MERIVTIYAGDITGSDVYLDIGIDNKENPKDAKIIIDFYHAKTFFGRTSIHTKEYSYDQFKKLDSDKIRGDALKKIVHNDIFEYVGYRVKAKNKKHIDFQIDSAVIGIFDLMKETDGENIKTFRPIASGEIEDKTKIIKPKQYKEYDVCNWKIEGYDNRFYLRVYITYLENSNQKGIIRARVVDKVDDKSYMLPGQYKVTYKDFKSEQREKSINEMLMSALIMRGFEKKDVYRYKSLIGCIISRANEYYENQGV